MTKALYAEFQVIPGNEVRVRELITQLASRVREEPGNVLFEPHVLEADPNHYFVYEVYVDDAAFEAHLAADHGQVFNAELSPLVTGGASRLTLLR